MNDPGQQENIIADFQDNYLETQKEILAIEIKKTRNKLFTIAIVHFAFSLLGLIQADLVLPETILAISVIPVAILILAFLSLKEPLLAMIIATIIVVGYWAYIIYVFGAVGALAGWLSKAILVYLLIAGFQNASEAQRIKRELKAV